ncbi:MAG: hypothetical protein ACXWWC_00335 [Chitinophagaceae bacterium]
MKKDLYISTSFDQPVFLEDFVEKLAYRHYDIGYSNAIVPHDGQALETSSTETYVSGTLALEEKGELINMPFITCFLFTCTKAKDESYKLTWSSSLS